MTGSEENEDSQWFKDWAKEHGLSWKTTGALRKRDCANKETLCSLQESDLSDMLAAEKITFGQFGLLRRRTLEELRKPSATAKEPAPEAVTEAVPGSPSQLAATVNDPGTPQAAVLDPSRLTLKDIRHRRTSWPQQVSPMMQCIGTVF